MNGESSENNVSQSYKTNNVNAKGSFLLPLKRNSGERVDYKNKIRTQQDIIRKPIGCYRKDKNNFYVAIDGIQDTNPKNIRFTSVTTRKNTCNKMDEKRLTSDRRRRQRSFDNYMTNKQTYIPNRIEVFDNDTNSKKLTNQEYTVQKLINNIDFYNNPGFIQDLMYRIKFLESENKKLKSSLREKEDVIKSLEQKTNPATDNSDNMLFKKSPIAENKLVNDLRSKIEILQNKNKNLVDSMNQLEVSVKEEKYKIKLKMEEYYRKYMEEYKRQLILDFMTNGNEFKNDYFKDHIIKLNKDIDDLKNEVAIHQNTNDNQSEIEELRNRLFELEAENRNIMNRYYEFKSSLFSKDGIEALEISTKRIAELEEQLRNLKRKFNVLY